MRCIITCDHDTKVKLSNVSGIEKMKPAEIWEQVELMFLHSNPLYTRRIQAMKTNILKGETVSENFLRLLQKQIWQKQV